MRLTEIQDWTEASIRLGEFQPCPECAKDVTQVDLRGDAFEHGPAVVFRPCGHGWYKREGDSETGGVWFHYTGVKTANDPSVM